MYAIYEKYKNGKLKKHPIDVVHNYESAIPDKTKDDHAIVGISGIGLWYSKTNAVKDCVELNLLWGREAFVFKKVELKILD